MYEPLALGLKIFQNIIVERERYRVKNGKCPEYLILGRLFYVRLNFYLTREFSFGFTEDSPPHKLLGMKVLLVDNEDVLIVGCNKFLGLKGE